LPTSKNGHFDDRNFANIPYGGGRDAKSALSLVSPTIKSSSLTKVRAVRVTNREEKYPRATFGLAADMKEVGRSGDTLKLRFLLAVETSPLVQRAEIEGQVEVKFDLGVLAATGGQLGEGFASELALELYKLHYQTIYSLFETLSLESPSPWLLKDVHLVK
jgi:hypothetical protein